jgi:hypothetical protein
MWTDKVPLPETSTGQLRKLIYKQKDKTTEQIGTAKWRLQIPGVWMEEREIWKAVWVDYREENVNHFLWQIVCQIPSTKWYIYIHHLEEDSIPNEKIRRDNARTWCSRCPDNAHEDLLHLLWGCPDSRRI